MVCCAESTTAAVAASQFEVPLHALEVTIKAPVAKKKGAVIGSAPKLSHEGLVAAAKAAEDKAAAEKRALQLAAKKAAAAEVKANKKKPKLAASGGSIDFNLSQLSNHLLCLYQLLPPLWLKQHLVRCQLLILRPSKANVSRKKQ